MMEKLKIVQHSNTYIEYGEIKKPLFHSFILNVTSFNIIYSLYVQLWALVVNYAFFKRKHLFLAQF